MPSPFPGMSPYLESRWGTFHGPLTIAIAAYLNQALPADLEARVEQQVRIESVADDDPRLRRPDVAVVELDHASGGEATTGTLAVADPEEIRIRYLTVPVVQRSVYIVDLAAGERIVTAVEVLSPANKRSGVRNREYRRKLHDFGAAGTNWVELDLLRSSRDRLQVRWAEVPADRRAAYMAVTCRVGEQSLRVRPISLRRPLPTLAVPTRPGEADVSLDLQAAFTRAYADGSFKSIDYTRPPDPPLADADAAWAAELLARRSAAG